MSVSGVHGATYAVLIVTATSEADHIETSDAATFPDRCSVPSARRLRRRGNRTAIPRYGATRRSRDSTMDLGRVVHWRGRACRTGWRSSPWLRLTRSALAWFRERRDDRHGGLVAINDEDDTQLYHVVVNADEMYSIWPADREMPPGWKVASQSLTKADCEEYIRGVWTDMRPLSLQRKSESW